MKRATTLCLGTTAVLAITACGAGNGNEQVPETITMTQTTTEWQAADPEGSSPSRNADEKPDVSPEEAPEPEPAAPAAPAGNHNINAGQVGGDCGTTSLGNPIRADEATSCEFAAAIFDAALQATFVVSQEPADHIQLPKTTITVASPVTGEPYELMCYTGSDSTNLRCQQSGQSSVGASFSSDFSDPIENHLNVIR